MNKNEVDKLKQLCADNGVSHRGMNAATLRSLRRSLQLTQAQMAAKLGIGVRMYIYAEHGEKPLSKASAMLAEQLQQELRVPLA